MFCEISFLTHKIRIFELILRPPLLHEKNPRSAYAFFFLALFLDKKGEKKAGVKKQ